MRFSRRFDRIVLIVLDGVGIGELPDAADFGDTGSNTLGNLIRARGYLKTPNLCGMGLGELVPALPCGETITRGAYGRCAEKAPGKDSTSGHWEMMGYVPERPFPLFPDGFPPSLIVEFERLTCRKVLGNIAASGTEIVKELGASAYAEGALIVYTSADSVFQIAAHVKAVPLADLYRYCELARGLLQGDLGVSRVIARPFDGEEGVYYRTPDRRDYSLEPGGYLVLDALAENGLPVYGVGKVDDLYAGRGIADCIHIPDNRTGISRILRLLKERFEGLLLANLNDTDTKYGHRNDVEGYARAIEEFDEHLPIIKETLNEGDLLIIASDHGNDPTTISTDHSREYTPLLSWYRRINTAISLGTRGSLWDIGKTIVDNFIPGNGFSGTSYLDEI